MKTEINYIQGLLIFILLCLVFFGLIPAQYRLWKVNHMIGKNMDLEIECQNIVSSKDFGDYNYWWETLECQKYREFHKEYEQWLLE